MIFATFSSVGWLLEIGTDFRDYQGGYSNSYLHFSKNQRPSSSIYNHGGSQKIEEVK
jgi:hypothetical protein